MKIENLSKSYGKNQVLKDISLTFNQGEKLALLGNNGAGKTTLMNIINGNLVATSGKIDFGQMQLSPQNTGYIMQNMLLPADARASEIMALFAHTPAAQKYGLELAKSFKLEKFINQKFSSLSGGQKQKLFLVSTLQNQPQYFFLDEITTGLDSESRAELFDFLTKNPAVKNATIVLVTHYLEEALKLCDRFVILQEGRLIADFKKSELIQTDFSEITFTQEIPEFADYKIAEKTYKLPVKLALSALSDHAHTIENYQKTYTIDLEELLQ